MTAGDDVVPIGRGTARGKWLFVASMLTVALALAVASIVIYLIHYQAELDRKACARAVAARDDARAMFVWVGEAFPESDFAHALIIELDHRLPRLACPSTNIPTPVSA